MLSLSLSLSPFTGIPSSNSLPLRTSDIRDFKDIARERESISHLIASTKNEIKQVLQTTFPELESVCNIFPTTMLMFLKEFPSAHSIRAAKSKVVTEALEKAGRGRKVSVSADDIIRAAKSSIASNSLARELIHTIGYSSKKCRCRSNKPAPTATS